MVESGEKLQRIQSFLKRTHKGRQIADALHNVVDSWAIESRNEYDWRECNTCGLILKANRFLEGCRNCGSTDQKPL